MRVLDHLLKAVRAAAIFNYKPENRLESSFRTFICEITFILLSRIKNDTYFVCNLKR